MSGRTATAVRAALAAAVLLAGMGRAGAARLPDWARAIADGAPELPEETVEIPTRVLFDEVHVDVDDDGATTTRWRVATQILGSQVSSLKRQQFSFQEGARLKSYKGWHLPFGDKARRGWQDPLELAVGQNFLDDVKARFVSVGGVARGSLVFFEFEVEEMPLDLSLTHHFGNGSETVLERFEVETPAPGWTVKHDWLRRPGPGPVVEGNVRRWEVRGSPAPQDEPLGPPVEETYPLLIVAVEPPSGAGVKPQVFRDWSGFAAWWEGLAKGREAVTPELEAAEKKAAGGAGGFFDLVPALSRYVRDGVRYVAKEVGIGNYQPRAAGQVLDQQYGDCKDKATLLRSLLKVAGITSYPVLINASHEETISAQVPTLGAFNHLIAAVAVPAGVEVPPRYAPAVVDAGELGRLILVDTTDEYTSIGAVPSHLAGKKALVVGGARSRLITVPAGLPADNRIERRFATSVHPDGSMDIEGTWRYVGAPAEWARSNHRASYEQRRKAVEHQLHQVFTDGQSKAYKAEPETADGAYVETVAWHVPPPAHGKLKEVPLFVGASDSLPRASVGAKRKTALRYDYPLTLVYENTLVGAPPEAALPPAGKRDGNGWSIVSGAQRDGERVLARWEMVLTRTRYDLDALGEVKKLWLAIGSTGRASLLLADPTRP